jgi:hypothetical protein
MKYFLPSTNEWFAGATFVAIACRDDRTALPIVLELPTAFFVIEKSFPS